MDVLAAFWIHVDLFEEVGELCLGLQDGRHDGFLGSLGVLIHGISILVVLFPVAVTVFRLIVIVVIQQATLNLHAKHALGNAAQVVHIMVHPLSRAGLHVEGVGDPDAHLLVSGHDILPRIYHIESLPHHHGVEFSFEFSHAFVLLYAISNDEIVDTVRHVLVGGFEGPSLSLLFFTGFHDLFLSLLLCL